jgi:hypothetical protein
MMLWRFKRMSGNALSGGYRRFVECLAKGGENQMINFLEIFFGVWRCSAFEATIPNSSAAI